MLIECLFRSTMELGIRKIDGQYMGMGQNPEAFEDMPGALHAKLVPVHTGERSLGSRRRLRRVLKRVGVSPSHLAFEMVNNLQ